MKKLWKLKISTSNSGKLAEFICRIYMRLHGYRIVAKNYRCGSGCKTPYGELDFVAVKGKIIIFCEVKKRQRDNDFLSALSYTQRQRILAGGQYFIEHHPRYKNYFVQHDVFFVKLPLSIRRLKNALYYDSIR